jgi:hypothetical protein
MLSTQPWQISYPPSRLCKVSGHNAKLNLSGSELDCAGADIFATPVGSAFSPDHDGVSTHLSGFGLELAIELCFRGDTPACGYHDTMNRDRTPSQ